MTTAVDMEQTPKPRKRTGRPRNSEAQSIKDRILTVAKTLQYPTQQEIADAAGVCRQTAAAYLAKYGIDKQEVDQFRDNRADLFASKQKEILAAITPDKLDKTGAKDLAIALAVVYDKERLESGQSSVNVSSWVKIVTDSHSNNIKDVSNSPNT